MTDPAAHQPHQRPGRLRVLATIARSPRLRRVQLAFAAFNVTEWATWIAITVYAYGRGGAAEAGLAAVVQLAPSALIAPIASTLGDRYPRATVLRAGYFAQGAAALTAAVALGSGAPAPLVYLAGTVMAAAITLTRPVQGALLPELADTAEELTAANVVSSTIENAGVFLGPAVAGLLLTIAGPAAVFAVCGALMAVAAASIPVPEEEWDQRFVPLGSAIRHEALGGLRALGRTRHTRAVVTVLGASYVLLGALDVFYVVLAIDVLGLDDGAVGVLNASVGAGGLAGAGLAVVLVGRRDMAVWLVAGALGFGLGVAVAGIASSAAGLPAAVALVAAGAALLLAGAGRAVSDVASWTLLQRGTPSHVLTRVFGVLEGINSAGQGLGAVIAAILVIQLGPGSAIAAVGLAVPIVAILRFRVLHAFEQLTLVDATVLARMREVPMFAALTPPVLERLAAAAITLDVAPRQDVVREGEIGDRFYVLDAGTVSASIDGREVRVLVPGDSFGEIALLRDVPRTATVTAREPARLLAIERDLFLEALAGRPRSRVLAERVVEERLATS